VIGQLRDPLLGLILGVRLYRRRCFREFQVPDSISPMHDFEASLQHSGWSMLCALHHSNGNGSGNGNNSFGEHRPNYGPQYTFIKFSLSGVRNRYRGSGDRLRNVFRRLRNSPHPAAILAQIAAAHGIFSRERADLLGRLRNGTECERLSGFLESDGVDSAASDSFVNAVHDGDLRAVFATAVKTGIRLNERGAGASFRRCMEALARREGDTAWIATIGLCHGLFMDRYDDEKVAEEFDWMRPLVCSP
jgi:hypothetical protein